MNRIIINETDKNCSVMKFGRVMCIVNVGVVVVSYSVGVAETVTVKASMVKTIDSGGCLLCILEIIALLHPIDHTRTSLAISWLFYNLD